MSMTVWANRIDASIRFFIYVMIFWLPYSSAVVETSVIISVLLWTAKRFILWRSLDETARMQPFCFLRSFAFPKNSLTPYICFFMTIAAFSAAGSAFPEIALRGLLTKTAEWFAVYLLVCEVFTRRKHLLIAVGIFLFTTAAVCADSFIQYYLTHKDIFNARPLTRGGATASFAHANSLGGYLAFAVPFMTGLAVGGYRGKWAGAGMGVLVAAAIWAAAITYSRAAWVGIGVGLGLLGVLKNWKWALGVVVAGMVGIGVLSLVVSPAVKERWRLTPDSLSGATEWRTHLWADSMPMIRDRPLFGHGINLYMRLFQEYRRKLEGNFDYGPTYAHNSFIQLACETGLLGLLGMTAFLAMFFRTVFGAARKAARREEHFLQALGTASAAGAAGFLVHSFFDVDFYSLQLSLLFWTMAGVAISSDNVLNNLSICDKKITQPSTS